MDDMSVAEPSLATMHLLGFSSSVHMCKEYVLGFAKGRGRCARVSLDWYDTQFTCKQHFPSLVVLRQCCDALSKRSVEPHLTQLVCSLAQNVYRFAEFDVVACVQCGCCCSLKRSLGTDQEPRFIVYALKRTFTNTTFALGRTFGVVGSSKCFGLLFGGIEVFGSVKNIIGLTPPLRFFAY